MTTAPTFTADAFPVRYTVLVPPPETVLPRKVREDLRVLQPYAMVLNLPDDPELAARRTAAVQALTPLERQVATLAAEGLTNKAIADRLDLAEATVKGVIRAAMRTLGVETRTQVLTVYHSHLGIDLGQPKPATGRVSDCERGVLDAVADGLCNKSAAVRLRITEATVKVHLKNAFRKLGVDNRTQAARLWLARRRSKGAA